MRRRWLPLALALAGCSAVYDTAAKDLPLVGVPPNLATLPHLNQNQASSVDIVYGSNAYWASFSEQIATPMGKKNALRLLQLEPPGGEQVLFADEVYVTWRYFYIFRANAMTPDMRDVIIVSAGECGMDQMEAQCGVHLSVPLGPALVLTGGADDVMLYWVEKHEATTFQIYRRDGKHMRTIPIPPSVDAVDPEVAQFYFSDDGSWLFVRDGDGDLAGHSTLTDQDVDLGVQPRLMYPDWGRGLFVTCGAESGLRTVPTDGSAATTLDPSPCDIYGDLIPDGDRVLYTVGNQVRGAALDGSTPPAVVLDNGRRVIALRGHDLLYSRDASDRYVNGAGDGWLGSWRFMERGTQANWSRDGKRLRWVEHSATTNGAGDLLSAPLDGQPLRLARNVIGYDELSDGRVLAAADHPFRGVFNRIVVVDEQTRQARWVCDQAADYVHIPASSDLLVDVVTGPSSFDIVRVPVPPR